MTSGLSVANTGQEVANWISEHTCEKLPAGLGHARDLAPVCQFAETNAAKLEKANVAMFATAAPATIHRARRKLRRTVGFGDLILGSHKRELGVEWKTELLQEHEARFFVTSGCCNRYLETVQPLDFIRTNFWKRDMLAESKGGISLRIDNLWRNSAEVTNTWEGGLR